MLEAQRKAPLITAVKFASVCWGSEMLEHRPIGSSNVHKRKYPLSWSLYGGSKWRNNCLRKKRYHNSGPCAFKAKGE